MVPSSGGGDEEVGEHREISAEETAEMMKNSHSVIITPATVSAVAQRAGVQGSGIAEKLRARVSKKCRFGIHPVGTGASTGHMNVLLAEAESAFDIVLEMDGINDDFSDTDTVLVIGAKRIPSTRQHSKYEEPNRRHAGVEVWKAGVVVLSVQ